MAKPINIFIIYAREDKEEKKNLLDFLSPMIDSYNLTIWHDEYIQPGQEWKPSIESRLNITDIFILLVSVNFLNSKFIKQTEFKYAIDRHRENKSIVIPVIIKYCLWDDPLPYDNYSFSLNQLQVLPAEGKPIVEWKSVDEAYSNIAKGIRSVIIERRTNLAKLELQEKELWNQAFEKKSISSYNEYLQNYPNGEFYEQAKTEVIRLEEKEKETGERNKQEIEKAKTESERKKVEEEILWKSTCDINTVSAYKNYLEKTELGLYREQADKFIAEIEKKNQEIIAKQERLVMMGQENALWQRTVTENTSNAFKEYLQEYPAGNYRQDALTTIGNIEEIEKKEREILAEEERILKQEKEKKLGEETKSENTKAGYEKYFFIGGSAVVIGIIILLVLKFNTPVIIKSEINNPNDTTGQVAQPTTSANNELSQQPATSSANAKVKQPPENVNKNPITKKVQKPLSDNNLDQTVVTNNYKLLAESMVSNYLAAFKSRDVNSLVAMSSIPFYNDHDILVSLSDVRDRFEKNFAEKKSNEFPLIKSIKVKTVAEWKNEGLIKENDRILSSLNIPDDSYFGVAEFENDALVIVFRKLGKQLKVAGIWD